MKITIEIINEKFSYSYEVGKNTQQGEHPISVKGLQLFSELLTLCWKCYDEEHNEWIDEVKAKAYLEKHQELLTPKEDGKGET